VITVLYQLGALVLHFVLGEPAPGREVLLVSLVPTIVLNLLLTVPVYRLVRRLLRQPEWTGAAREVRLLG